MACIDARNTIDRRSFDTVIAQVYDDVLILFQKDGVPVQLTARVREFEEKLREETKGDKIEMVSNAIASAGLFVSDPAGGPSNLRLPHKQFYEYLIAKAGWIISAQGKSLTARCISLADRKNPLAPLCEEEQSLVFFSELIGQDFSVFRSYRLMFRLIVFSVCAALSKVLLQVFSPTIRSRWSVDPDKNIEFLADEQRFDWPAERQYRMNASMVILWFTGAILAMLLMAVRPMLNNFLWVPPFVLGALAMTLAAVLIAIFLREDARGTALKRIVANRLISGGHVPGRRLPLLKLYRECLLVLTSPGKSDACNPAGDTWDRGASANVHNDLRDLIAPVA